MLNAGSRSNGYHAKGTAHGLKPFPFRPACQPLAGYVAEFTTDDSINQAGKESTFYFYPY
jgi:hypothetical protein